MVINWFIILQYTQISKIFSTRSKTNINNIKGKTTHFMIYWQEFLCLGWVLRLSFKSYVVNISKFIKKKKIVCKHTRRRMLGQTKLSLFYKFDPNLSMLKCLRQVFLNSSQYCGVRNRVTHYFVQLKKFVLYYRLQINSWIEFLTKYTATHTKNKYITWSLFWKIKIHWLKKVFFNNIIWQRLCSLVI